MKNIAKTCLFSSLVAITLSACQKQFSIDGLVPGSAAQGTLYDSSGNCMASTVSGTFYDGVAPNGNLAPGADTAYVLAQVNVTTAGAYNITSNLQNGVSFSGTGNFTNTGINTVKLLPAGTPAAIGSNTYTFTFNNSTCNFTVVTADSTGRVGGGGAITNGTWQFSTDSSGYFHGAIKTATLKPDSVYWNTIVPQTITGGTILFIEGLTPTSDTGLVLYVLFPGNTIVPGTYYTQAIGTDSIAYSLFAFSVTTASSSIYEALQDPSSPSKVAVTVAYDSSTKTVSGTFSGVANDDAYYLSGAVIGIVNGKFSATLQ